jgi:hypothetical protein
MTSSVDLDTHHLSVQAQTSSLDVNTVSPSIESHSPTLARSPLTVDATLAPALTPSRSSSSRDAPEAILDSPPQAITRAPVRSFCDKIDCSESFALHQQLR